MENLTLFVVIALLGVTIIIQIVQLFRKASIDLGPVEQALQSIEKSYERVERAVREEITHNREELANLSSQSRQELCRNAKKQYRHYFQTNGGPYKDYRG